MAERRAAGKNEGAPPRDLFDLMDAARDPETGESFTDEQLGDQVATMILAGHETTATALFWSLYLLALDPATQDRVAAEVESASVDGGFELERLKFTRAVIDETMRLYPPAFLIARAAAGPDTVAGLPVKKKDVILIAPWLLHRHEKLWRDPNAFIPSRFMAPAPPPDRFAYLPFGVGPRVCIGAHFALVEATLALAKLIGAFRVGLARPGAGAADRGGDDAARPLADVPHHALGDKRIVWTLARSDLGCRHERYPGAVFGAEADRRSVGGRRHPAPDRERSRISELNRINVLDFSKRTGLDEERVISGFLHASRLGLFDLTWNVLCPGCGGVLDAHSTLKSLRHDDYHCGLCACGYEASVDEQVEVAFTVSPQVRRIAAHDPNTLPIWEYFKQVFWSSGVDLNEESFAVALRRRGAGCAGIAGRRERRCCRCNCRRISSSCSSR